MSWRGFAVSWPPIWQRSDALRIECSGDELVLAMLSLIQMANPRLLRSSPEGFSVDLGPLQGKPALTAEEELIVRLHDWFAAAEEGRKIAVELSQADIGRVTVALEVLELRGKLPPDVVALSRSLRTSLASAR